MVRVLIVDDSAVTRSVLEKQLSRDPEIEVIGSAPDAYVARELILKLRPDVLTLDIEMPRMNGLTFLRKLMTHYPLPVIIISSVAPQGSRTALEALRTGAVDVFCKPGSADLGEIHTMLIPQIKAAARIDARQLRSVAPVPVRRQTAKRVFGAERVIVMGASTGGTCAIETVLRDFPPNAPPVLVVQHMPPHFTQAFANGLNRVCAIEVREAQPRDRLRPGAALVAPGGTHMVVAPADRGYMVRMTDGPRVHYQRPAVDVLFQSVAAVIGQNAVGVLLTGMGCDGARGLLEMRQAGARTIAQDESSCVVFGMPRAAMRMGAAEMVLPLGCIAEAVLKYASAARGAA
jgi:two-component system chemotaxis response regulator CheB